MLHSFPRKRSTPLAYGVGPAVAEVENFDRSTPESYLKEDYSLHVFERTQPKVDCAFLISMCIAIDFIDWPHYLPSTYPTTRPTWLFLFP